MDLVLNSRTSNSNPFSPILDSTSKNKSNQTNELRQKQVNSFINPLNIFVLQNVLYVSFFIYKFVSVFSKSL